MLGWMISHDAVVHERRVAMLLLREPVELNLGLNTDHDTGARNESRSIHRRYFHLIEGLRNDTSQIIVGRWVSSWEAH